MPLSLFPALLAAAAPVAPKLRVGALALLILPSSCVRLLPFLEGKEDIEDCLGLNNSFRAFVKVAILLKPASPLSAFPADGEGRKKGHRISPQIHPFE